VSSRRFIQSLIESQRRSSHEQKTLAERQDYWESKVKLDRKQTPTIGEQSNEFDSTETPLPVEPETTPSYQRTRRPKRKFNWLREHWLGVLAGAVVTFVLSLGGWALSQLYSLNRQIGEIRVQVDGTTKQQDQLKGDFQRFEEQVRQEMDRMNDRLDRVPRSR
jgi:hypothetical protein